MTALSGDEVPVSDPQRFAVMGNPIKHSKSPLIHRAFAAELEHPIQYRAVKVEPEQFEAAALKFFAGGGAGLNVTLPFKERAFALADEASTRAETAGAANTLIALSGGGLRADNTDGVGMIRDMVANHGWRINGSRVLVLGAGGAVRGVLEPLMREGPARIYIANRTGARATALVQSLASNSVAVHGGGLADIPDEPWDLIINGTAASLQGELPDLPEIRLGDRCACYDMAYGDGPTTFMRWAASHTAWAVADGLGMLVEQAAESYWLWRHQRPNTRPVIQQLREMMAA